MDVGSSSAASSVMRLVSPATKSLVVDLAFLFEGHSADELPEEVWTSSCRVGFILLMNGRRISRSSRIRDVYIPCRG